MSGTATGPTTPPSGLRPCARKWVLWPTTKTAHFGCPGKTSRRTSLPSTCVGCFQTRLWVACQATHPVNSGWSCGSGVRCVCVCRSVFAFLVRTYRCCSWRAGCDGTVLAAAVQVQSGLGRSQRVPPALYRATHPRLGVRAPSGPAHPEREAVLGRWFVCHGGAARRYAPACGVCGCGR